MKSINFPNMFENNSTKLVKDFEASKQSIKLLLKSEKGKLFGDPYFGVRLKRYIFNQNDYILKDIIIDEIYTQLALFEPQLKVNRRDIKIIQDMGTLYCNFKAINIANFQTDSYSLVLFSEDEQK